MDNTTVRVHSVCSLMPILVQVTIYRKLRIGQFVEMAISTNPKPTIYRNLYENTDLSIKNETLTQSCYAAGAASQVISQP